MDETQLQAANIAQAQAFAELFPGIKVTACGVKGPNAMAAHHNAETRWGFTVQFITTPDEKNHIHAWVEFVGEQAEMVEVANQIKKIVGG